MSADGPCASCAAKRDRTGREHYCSAPDCGLEPRELVTAGEIVKRYHISRATFRDWKADPEFPEPVPWTPELRAQYDPRTRHVWDREQIAKWRLDKQNRRHRRKSCAVKAYGRRAGETGHLSATAHAFGVSVDTLRTWARAAGLPTPRG